MVTKPALTFYHTTIVQFATDELQFDRAESIFNCSANSSLHLPQ